MTLEETRRRLLEPLSDEEAAEKVKLVTKEEIAAALREANKVLRRITERGRVSWGR